MDQDTTHSTDEQAMADTLKQRQALETLLAERLADAQAAREQSGIEDIWLEDEDQYNGYDALNPPSTAVTTKTTLDQDGRKPTNRSTVYLNITKPKTDTAVSRVQEMLLPTDEKPWDLGPTPVPEVQKAIDRKDQREIKLADGKTSTAEMVAKAMIAQAVEKARRLSDHIEDWFVEGSVYAQMRHVIRDGGRIGTGVLKGPFPVEREEKRWDIEGGASILQVVKRVAPTSRRIDPWDIFPDPSCGDDIHAGAYVFERDYMTGRRLRGLAGVPGYDKQALAEVLAEGPRRTARRDRYMREKPGESSVFDTDQYEVYYYYGDIPPDRLIAAGIVVKGLNDAQEPEKQAAQLFQMLQLTTVSVVATMVNDRIVRVSMNPLETGAFPFDVFNWEPVDGQPWGRGVPRKMAVAQKMLNASVRALLENAGLSAGPQIVIDKELIEPANQRYEITGRKLWFKKHSDNPLRIDQIFGSFLIPSAQRELQAVIEFALRMADELSNLPLLLQGVAATAPKTLGGQQMAQTNASSPLKAIAIHHDDRVTVPHLKRYYDWAMQSPDVPAEAKGDMQCKARGSTALIQRDQAGQFLMQAAPMVKDPTFGIDPKKWFSETARAWKFDPTSIQYTPEEAKDLEQQMAEQGQPTDPRVQAAQLNQQTKQAELQAELQDREQERAFKAQEAELDRAHERLIHSMEVEIQAMEFAGQREVSLEQVKAMLAKSSMDIRNKREMFAAERQFAMTTGEGRGL